MITKKFGDKKLIIRELDESDLRKVKKFQDFTNSFVKEDAMLLSNRPISRKEELKWLKDQYSAVKAKKLIYFFVEHDNKMVASTEVKLHNGRMSHVGEFGIAIRNGYRGMGLGTYLGNEIIKAAKNRLKIKIARLSVYPKNKPAQALYKKLGFKQVAVIPKQAQYKGRLIDEIVMLKFV